jgi:hypothetical protein
MHRRIPRHSQPLPLYLAGLAGLLLTACSVVGPTTISSGRLAYNEAITATDNQQMLMVLIHNRYGERGHLLNVASVTANVSVTTSAGVQAGFGNSSDYRGNLVPFAGSVVYEENPTISYVPVAGERYLRELTSPISLAMLTQLTRSTTDPGGPLLALVNEVNGIYNPDFSFSDMDQDPRFDEFVHLVTDLSRQHRLHWVEQPGHEGRFSMVIDQSSPENAARVAQLLTLLGLPPADREQRLVVIPVSLALEGGAQGGLGISTRSVWDMVEILSARVEVPGTDISQGMVVEAPPPGRLGRALTIHYSRDEPEHAYIALEYRDGWFYIDQRDLLTKQYFKLLGGLWSMVMSNAASNGAAAPVLTVPVSR